jgi:hypothetical protein
MQTLAIGCQFPFCRCMLASDGRVAFALFPMHTLFASLLDPPLVVIVVWIVGPPLTLHLALQTSPSASIGGQFCAEREQVYFPLSWHDCKRRWPYIEADDVVTRWVLRLLMRCASQDQLNAHSGGQCSRPPVPAERMPHGVAGARI